VDGLQGLLRPKFRPHLADRSIPYCGIFYWPRPDSEVGAEQEQLLFIIPLALLTVPFRKHFSSDMVAISLVRRTLHAHNTDGEHAHIIQLQFNWVVCNNAGVVRQPEI
jgi:hypothetical protein